MFDLFKKIMPKEERFFDMFNRHSTCIVGASRTLLEILDGGPGAPAACARLLKQEEEADTISQEVLLALRLSFITPFDRSGIKAPLKGRAKADPLAFIGGQELCGCFGKVADRFEDVADVISGIVIKHHLSPDEDTRHGRKCGHLLAGLSDLRGAAV